MRALLIAFAICSTGFCPATELPPVVLVDKVVAPSDGGIVIARARPRWVFRIGMKNVEPDIIDVAPGLHVYRLPPNLAASHLYDVATPVAEIATAVTPPPALPAPNAKWIKHVEGRRRRGFSLSVTVALAGPAPADALALIVVDPDTNTPRSWGVVSKDSTRVVVFVAGRCVLVPEGTKESEPGTRVALRWLDRYGRLSPITKAFVVARGLDDAPDDDPPPPKRRRRKR